MINLISKFNNYFILSVFLLSVVAFQFGFLDPFNALYLSSINIFLIVSILVCVSTKNIKKIIIPMFIIAFLSSIYSNYNIFILIPTYLFSATIIFYLNKGPLFITDYYRFIILVILSVIIFKALFYLILFLFNYLYYKNIIIPEMNYEFLFSIIFEIIYSILILSIFKPDIKYINYEFLVGD